MNELSNNLIAHQITQIISQIQPIDPLEQEHKADTLSWIASGAPIFRVQKPDIPPKHLVCYFVVFDEEARKILLVDHKMAKLWLPSGGHVEPDEDPKETVRRECLEELELKADFWREDPVFISSTLTVNDDLKHWDVSLWYVLKGNHADMYNFDPREFHGIKWFDMDALPLERSDPQMGRFVKKLKGKL